MTHLLLDTAATEVSFLIISLPPPSSPPSPRLKKKKREKCRPLSSIEALHHFKQGKCLPKKEKKKKTFPTLANILSMVKHFSAQVRAVCLKPWFHHEWRYEQLFHSGSFPSFFSCKFSLSGMLMGNVILFLFAAVLLF